MDNLVPADLAAALLAVRKLPEGADRDLTMRLLVARWADVDPEAALAFAAKHNEFDQLTGDIFQQLATSNLPSALARAQALTDPNLHYQALRGALGVMAANDPAGALRLAASTENLPRTEPLSSMIYGNGRKPIQPPPPPARHRIRATTVGARRSGRFCGTGPAKTRRLR